MSLPLSLLSFTALKSSEKAVLPVWAMNPYEEIVEVSVLRSTNVMTFVEVNTLSAEVNQTSFTFLDGGLFPMLFYYKVKQVELKGTITFSSLKMVDMITPNINLNLLLLRKVNP